MGRFHQLAFTPSVQAVQAAHGSQVAYARAAARAGGDRLGPDEVAFLTARDSGYLASVGEGGWPYVQHRGGPPGFIHVLDDRTLAFADLRGNKQYVSVGNLGHDPRVAMIFVDYPAQARLKLLARARIVEPGDDPELLRRLAIPGAVVERAIVLSVEGFDWNCPQHITPRFTEAEIDAAVAPLRARLAELERENRALRAAARTGG